MQRSVSRAGNSSRHGGEAVRQRRPTLNPTCTSVRVGPGFVQMEELQALQK